MKFTKCMKTVFAGVMAFAVAATSVPVNLLAETQDAGTDAAATLDPVLHWNMTQDADGTLKDVTGNGHNGIADGKVEFSDIDHTPVVNLNGGAVTIPDGTISTGATEVTVNMLVKIPQNIKSTWMWCLGTSRNRYIYLTGCANQDSHMRGGLCYDSNDTNKGYNFESVIGGSKALSENEWQNITVTFVEGKDYTFYLNGVKQASIDVTTGKAESCTLQDLMTAGDGLDGYMGHSFYYPNDPNFQGAVADFRIYEKAMTQDEITDLYSGINETLKNLKLSDFGESAIDLTADDCRGENISADEVTTDLTLPAKTTITVDNVRKNADITAWKSSNTKVITDDGKVTRLFKDMDVTMTASVTLNGRTVGKDLKFTVKSNATDDEIVAWDADLLDIPAADAIRGNITLPDTGDMNSTITWESSDENVIRTTANGNILPGQVTRQKEDTKVTLTATLTKGEASTTKEFDCTVIKEAEDVELTDYLFAYFPFTDNFSDERIYFGISQDGLNFTALNDSKPVLESKLGTHGLRDPFIIRSHEGDKFYLIATDLAVHNMVQDGVTYPGQNWDHNQTEGSQSIMVWESTDLVNWSEQRMCKVAVDDAGCAWAPEAYWDDDTEQYVVFWASMLKTGGKQRLYYATTRDFYTFSDAQVWFEEDGSVIDTTVIKVDDYYYRYTKNEQKKVENRYGTPSKRIYCERSKSLTAPASEWEYVYKNCLNVDGGQIEGGCIFEINTEDVENAKKIAALKGYELKGDRIFALIADATGVTIFPGLSDNITTGQFNVLGTTANASVNGTPLYSMPEPAASHGTIMPITSEEYDNLMKKYNSRKYTAAIKKLVNKAVSLSDTSNVTSDITLPAETTEGNTITWTSSNEAVVSATGKVTRPAATAGDATVELTATFAINGNGDVRRQEGCTKTFTVTVKALDPVVTPPTDNNNNNNNNNSNNTQPAPANYTVTFVGADNAVLATQTVTSGATAAKPADPVRKKYTFEGWYAGTTAYDFAAPVTADLTITAKWAKVSVSKAKLSSAKNSKRKTLVVKAKKTSGAAGYEYIIATDKKFKKNVKKSTTTKTSVTFKKLKKGKTYYVKVRAYKKDSANSKVYGSYSAVKKVKIRK